MDPTNRHFLAGDPEDVQCLFLLLAYTDAMAVYFRGLTVHASAAT
jgi:hypothetical protein